MTAPPARGPRRRCEWRRRIFLSDNLVDVGGEAPTLLVKKAGFENDLFDRCLAQLAQNLAIGDSLRHAVIRCFGGILNKYVPVIFLQSLSNNLLGGRAESRRWCPARVPQREARGVTSPEARL